MANSPVTHRVRFAIMLGPLALASCIAGGEQQRVEAPQQRSAAPRVAARPAYQPPMTPNQCFAELKAADVRFSPLADRSEDGGCRTIDTIKLLDFGTPTTNLGAMTCPLAKNFAAWARYAVIPAAQVYLGEKVVKIETMGSYSCRNIYGGRSGRLSQHAFANAVDVSAFVLADGRRISVEKNWNGSAKERAFLEALHTSACRRFGTVLGPEYNAAHYNHFHFDMSGNGYCR
ncbi:extensin family protein [Sphingorhabdus soli]|uniref:Extensin family protein n=1 Tax=Flavisphingopyxis soli TaxID=2601267 RepID=A0A5C6US70_9SPHN|nr:extensin family protein [Sphingorhabdus soli]TXC73655.1 extensin family protein [Sphingorhabdus soli]